MRRVGPNEDYYEGEFFDKRDKEYIRNRIISSMKEGDELRAEYLFNVHAKDPDVFYVIDYFKTHDFPEVLSSSKEDFFKEAIEYSMDVGNYAKAMDYASYIGDLETILEFKKNFHEVCSDKKIGNAHKNLSMEAFDNWKS